MKSLVSVLVMVLVATMSVAAGGRAEESIPLDTAPDLPDELLWPESELGPQPVFEDLAGRSIDLTVSLFAAGHVQMVTQLADNFNRLYPYININFEIQQAPTSEMHDALATQLVAGRGAPDIVAIEISRTGRFFTAPFNTQFREIALPGILADNLTQRPQYQDQEGRQVGVDLVGPEPGFLYYRQDLMEAAGVDLPIETWEDYIEAGRKLRDELGYKLTAMGIESESEGSQFMGLFVQAGNPLYRDGEFVLNDANTLHVLENIRQLYDEDLLVDAYRDDPILLQRYLGEHEDQVASFIMPTWFFITRLADNVDDPVWRIQTPPAFETSDYRAFSWGGTALSIVESQTQYPELAEAFLHYILSSENQIQKFENYGWLPSNLAAMDSERVLSLTQPQYFGDQPIGQIFSDAAANLPPYSMGPTWSEVFAEAGATFDRILSDPAGWLQNLEDLEAEVRN